MDCGAPSSSGRSARCWPCWLFWQRRHVRERAARAAWTWLVLRRIGALVAWRDCLACGTGFEPRHPGVVFCAFCAGQLDRLSGEIAAACASAGRRAAA